MVIKTLLRLMLWQPFFEGDYPPDSLQGDKKQLHEGLLPMAWYLIPNSKDIIRSKNLCKVTLVYGVRFNVLKTWCILL